jgi:ABC-type amino acid transport substrate-binding protein
MGYKEGNKPPYIGEMHDNSGAYRELFTLAAKKIGFQLKIVRLPKKRIYQQLFQGQIDFYPSSGFSQQREEYLYWFPNGFLSKQALLSTLIDHEITDFSQAQGTLLAPLGSSAASYAIGNPAIKIQKMGVLPIDKAILALQLGRGNFYIYDIDTLDYYLKRKQLISFEKISLKLHPNAIEKAFSSLQSAFSIHSKYFSATTNPNYNDKEDASFHNQKLMPSRDSVAYSFEQALKQLQETGETSKIYNKYFK